MYSCLIEYFCFRAPLILRTSTVETIDRMKVAKSAINWLAIFIETLREVMKKTRKRGNPSSAEGGKKREKNDENLKNAEVAQQRRIFIMH